MQTSPDFGRAVIALAALACCALAPGCGSSALTTTVGGSPDGSGSTLDFSGRDGAAIDLATVDRGRADLAARDLAALDFAAPDLAVPDLATFDFADLAVPDLGAPDLVARNFGDFATRSTDAAAPVDLAIADLWNCGGGYLNSDAANACPLQCSPAVEFVPPTDPPFHIPYCTHAAHNHNPPVNGFHWPWHADWGIYKQVLQREYWLHCLEHGGIVLLYNCPPANADGGILDGGNQPYSCPDAGTPPPPNSCLDEIAALEKFYAEHPLDELGVVRIVVAPDPLLPKKFAAVAWDWSFTFDQLDIPAIQCFIAARYGRGPEEVP